MQERNSVAMNARGESGRIFEPAYLEQFRTGVFTEKMRIAWEMLKACRICPRECGVNRLEGEIGVCNAPLKAKISRHFSRTFRRTFLKYRSIGPRQRVSGVEKSMWWV